MPIFCLKCLPDLVDFFMLQDTFGVDRLERNVRIICEQSKQYYECDIKVEELVKVSINSFQSLW